MKSLPISVRRVRDQYWTNAQLPHLVIQRWSKWDGGIHQKIWEVHTQRELWFLAENPLNKGTLGCIGKLTESVATANPLDFTV